MNHDTDNPKHDELVSYQYGWDRWEPILKGSWLPDHGLVYTSLNLSETGEIRL